MLPHPTAALGPSPSRGRKNALIPTVSPTLIFLARLGTLKLQTSPFDLILLSANIPVNEIYHK